MAAMASSGTVMLRDVEEADLPIFFEHQREPDANRMAAFPARAQDAFFAHWREQVLGNASNRKQTIIVGDVVVGYVASWEHGGKRLVAYWLGQAYWGRGIGTSALREFLAHETTRPLHAFVAVQNVGSIRVLERCGFQRVSGAASGADDVEEYLFSLDG
ncbi:MAG TPA: GNAT family protein [Kofleriaceae bacterium]|nr:GNAT family protein [Kofleriaceae bacterium]